MTRWEYKTVELTGNDPDKTLNEIGMLGWEVYQIEKNFVGNRYVYLKRELEEVK